MGRKHSGCFGLQSYKIWVIYTTSCATFAQNVWLFWITKLQNLSDIHNLRLLLFFPLVVVLDYKVTKFEWYTQLQSRARLRLLCCFGLQSYKIWVIYTTDNILTLCNLGLFWITKLQNLSDIHNVQQITTKHRKLFWITKLQNLSDIHNV